MIIFSPWQPDLSRMSLLTRPTLIVFHREDVQAVPFVAPLFDALTAAPSKERVGLAGGSNDGCGHHLFAGIDAEFVAAVARFIDKHKAMRDRPTEKPN